MSTKTMKFREKIVNAKMKRNWITSQMPKLTHEQVDLLYSMIHRWLKEQEV